jgi:hypothetical protein
MRNSTIALFILSALVSSTTIAQQNTLYKDTIYGVVLKIRPASLVNGYVMAGTEIPAGANKFIDVNIGLPGIGTVRPGQQPGGILARVGYKMPLVGTTPYSLIYFMPEVYFGRFRKLEGSNCFQCPTTPQEPYWGQLLVYSVGFGYRHINPATGFYFDMGTEVGFGYIRVRDYDHAFGTGVRPLLAEYMDPNGFNGYMISGHLAIGKAFKRKSRR